MINKFIFFVLSVFLLVGCISNKDRYIFVSNQLPYPIAIDYYAYNIKYFLEIDKTYSKKENREAYMCYKPLYCKRCEISYEGDNRVKVILPPYDTVAIAATFQIFYPGDVLVVGETRIYPSNVSYNEPFGFEILNYVKRFGDNMILNIDSFNINPISFPDSLNYPCKLIEYNDSINSDYSSYKFCRLANDTIVMCSNNEWTHKGKRFFENEKRFYHKQRQLIKLNSMKMRSEKD